MRAPMVPAPRTAAFRIPAFTCCLRVADRELAARGRLFGVLPVTRRAWIIDPLRSWQPISSGVASKWQEHGARATLRTRRPLRSRPEIEESSGMKKLNVREFFRGGLRRIREFAH